MSGAVSKRALATWPGSASGHERRLHDVRD
jgi:hypothetical protein